MKIPFLDLKPQNDAQKSEINAAIQEVIEKCAFAGGPYVAAFEESFAAFCGARHAVGVGSGTDALWLALLALGVGPGDEVITVPSTFMATAEAITYCGARPVFVDIDEETYTMDPRLLERAITPRTKAIIPVHLFGQVADMDPILEVACRHGLPVVEDACQAHGAEYKGRRAGSLGVAGCFSFYPGKNLGAFGDGGAVVTNNPRLAEELRLLRNYGQRVKNEHTQLGYNCRLDTVQAAILLVKLKYLDAWNARRRTVADWYHGLLCDADLVLPAARPEVEHIYHLYVVRHPERTELMQHLAELGVQCGIHYPHPLHRAQPFAHARTVPEGLPVCTELADRILSLPMFPELERAAVERIAEGIRQFSPVGSSR
jgi:dTDP-4-amino-4,6-dideoxygalactose transaminase